MNLYGPSEDTTYSTYWKAERKEGRGGNVPIGKPIANTRAYVLDEGGEAVPVGVAGELYLGGEGLARGYVNRPELTGERFLPDGVSGKAGERLYRTGDGVRWEVEGGGDRVERGEMEGGLEEQEGGERAVVVVVEVEEGGGKQLVGYV